MTTVVVHPVPVPVVSGGGAVLQVGVVVASHVLGVVPVVAGGVVVAVELCAVGHAVDEPLTQLTCADAVSEAVAELSLPTGTVATANSELLSKLVTWPPAC